MRACIQRVLRASVSVGSETVGAIEAGVLVLLGVAADDTVEDVEALAEKIATLRIFEDQAGKMNCSLIDTHGAMLVVSQFTLLGDCRKGRRPSFVSAAPPALAESLYEYFVEDIRRRGIIVATGRFRQHMEVSLVNNGPVTMLVDTRKLF